MLMWELRHIKYLKCVHSRKRDVHISNILWYIDNGLLNDKSGFIRGSIHGVMLVAIMLYTRNFISISRGLTADCSVLVQVSR